MNPKLLIKRALFLIIVSTVFCLDTLVQLDSQLFISHFVHCMGMGIAVLIFIEELRKL